MHIHTHCQLPGYIVLVVVVAAAVTVVRIGRQRRRLTDADADAGVAGVVDVCTAVVAGAAAAAVAAVVDEADAVQGVVWLSFAGTPLLRRTRCVERRHRVGFAAVSGTMMSICQKRRLFELSRWNCGNCGFVVRACAARPAFWCRSYICACVRIG